jgi:hypothetical protein
MRTDGHGWWWHLWNDPMRDNPWTWLAFTLIIGATFTLFWWIGNLRDRKRRREVNAIIERLERRPGRDG